MNYFFKKNWPALLIGVIAIIAPFVYRGFVLNDYGTSASKARTTANKIDVSINEDGSMNVVETMALKTKWKEVFKDISFQSSYDLDENGNLADTRTSNPRFSMAANDTHIRMIKNGSETIFDNYASKNFGDSTSDTSLQFSFLEGAETHLWPGETRPAEVACPSNKGTCSSIYLYNKDGLGPNVEIQYSYKILGAVVAYEDIAEINWKFATTNNMKTENVDVTIHLPQTMDNSLNAKDVYIYGHGTNGKITHDNKTPYEINMSSSKMLPHDEVEARILFPKSLLDLEALQSTSSLYDNYKTKDFLDTAIKYENHLQWLNGAYQDINYAVIILIITSIILTSWGLYKIFINYDKEYTSTFDSDYYRELPGDYPPALMSYLYNFRDLDKNCVTATLMDLIRRKVIIIDYSGQSLTDTNPNYRMTLNKIPDDVVLLPYEQKLLDWFFNIVGNGKELTLNQLDDYNRLEGNALKYQECNREFNTLLAAEGKKQKFFENPAKGRRQGKQMAGFLGFGLIIVFFINIFFPIVAPIYALGVLFALMIITLFYTYNLIRRTRNGHEDFVRWQAFKHFLEDFSNIKDYPMPGIEVWDQYMVYATAFGIADLVEKQVRFKYKELYMEEQFTHSCYFDYPLFAYYYTRRVTHTMIIASQTISTARARRAATSGGSGGRGGFGGGSSFGGGGSGMRGR